MSSRPSWIRLRHDHRAEAGRRQSTTATKATAPVSSSLFAVVAVRRRPMPPPRALARHFVVPRLRSQAIPTANDQEARRRRNRAPTSSRSIPTFWRPILPPRRHRRPTDRHLRLAPTSEHPQFQSPFGHPPLLEEAPRPTTVSFPIASSPFFP